MILFSNTEKEFKIKVSDLKGFALGFLFFAMGAIFLLFLINISSSSVTSYVLVSILILAGLFFIFFNNFTVLDFEKDSGFLFFRNKNFLKENNMTYPIHSILRIDVKQSFGELDRPIFKDGVQKEPILFNFKKSSTKREVSFIKIYLILDNGDSVLLNKEDIKVKGLSNLFKKVDKLELAKSLSNFLKIPINIIPPPEYEKNIYTI